MQVQIGKWAGEHFGAFPEYRFFMIGTIHMRNMKSWMPILLGITLALSACAELQQYEIERSVEGNLLYSSFPELKVQVDRGFIYLGNAERTEKDTSTHADGEPQDRTSSYLFGQFDSRKVLMKGTVIRLKVVRGDPSKAWQDGTAQTVKNPLDSGTVKILDEEYGYLLYTGKDFFTVEELGLLSSSGVSPCYLIKSLERKAGLGNKSQVSIFYLEDAASACSTGSCNECLQGKPLSGPHQQIVRDFDERSYQAISFQEPKKTVDATSRYVKPEDKPSQPMKTGDAPESMENRLKVLKDLLDKDLITREDYEKKKAEILEGL
jgi:hypothetical protein